MLHHYSIKIYNTEESSKESIGIDYVKNNILKFEEMYLQLHESIPNKIFSFEVKVTSQLINLYFVTDEQSAQIMVGQIYSIDPNLEIEKIKDPLLSFGMNNLLKCYSIFGVRNRIIPYKDYGDCEHNSFVSFLSYFSKLSQNETIYIQYVVRSVEVGLIQELNNRFLQKLYKLKNSLSLESLIGNGNKHSYEKILKKSSSKKFSLSVNFTIFVGKDASESQFLKIFNLNDALSIFNNRDFNILRSVSVKVRDFNYLLNRIGYRAFQVSARELATFIHFPSVRELPQLAKSLSKKQPPPEMLPTDRENKNISFFGLTTFRNSRIPFGFRGEDRKRHTYVVGKSGSGKSKLLELLIKADIENGEGVGVIDPHGDLIDNILKFVPENRISDVVIFDPTDSDYLPAINPLENVSKDQRMHVVIDFIEIFKKYFGANWSDRIEHLLRYACLTLLESPDATILSISKLLTDRNYRYSIVADLQDELLKNFWLNEFASYSEKYDSEAINPLINKLGQFISSDIIRNIIGQSKSTINFRDIIDSRKILLVKLPKGLLGEENASLLGSILITNLYQAVMSRAEVREEDRRLFSLYIDEFQNFATTSFKEILSESRKYGLQLTIANQYLGQLDNTIRTGVFGNIGSLICFRVGAEDASLLINEFAGRFSSKDLVNLGMREFCIKMLIDGVNTEAFSGKTLDLNYISQNHEDRCRELSRERYAYSKASFANVKQVDSSRFDNLIFNFNTDHFEEPL